MQTSVQYNSIKFEIQRLNNKGDKTIQIFDH